jgi:hypothetical protein
LKNLAQRVSLNRAGEIPSVRVRQQELGSSLIQSWLEPKAGGPRCELQVTSNGSKMKLSTTATKLVDGRRSVETAGTCGRAMSLRVAICERYGQSEESARRPGRSSVDIPDMSEVPDMQWCLPFRRQHAEGAVPVIPKANGARKLQTATESTKRATLRRISLHANTSQPYVTNEPPRRRAGPVSSARLTSSVLLHCPV